MKDQYVLAMYDIRGKQEYIYRSNHIKEIMGGSAIIEDCFKDYLYPAAKSYRNQMQNHNDEQQAIYLYDKDTENVEEFSREAFKSRMEGEQYLGEVVYEGGGNFFVLYKNKEVCVGVNKIFTKKLLEETYSLKVLCTYIEKVDFDNYKEDRKRLYEKHRLHEAKGSPVIPAQVLPFTQIDARTSMPLYKMQKTVKKPEKEEKVSRESYFKYRKYWERQEENPEEFGEYILDNIVRKKGEDSLLAMIYIDGNNMGAKVQNCLEDKQTYEECICQLREFSREIQKNYITVPMKKIDEALENSGNGRRRRYVIYAGDEITFICNAHDAYHMAKTYLETLPKGCSSCAGIAIFHSHAPYADVYRIAEECCESGKKKMKSEEIEDASLIDVHYCQSGIGIDLESIREKEVADLISKPWFVKLPEEKKKKDYVTTAMVEALAQELNKMGRSNVKGLAEYAKKGLADLKMDLKRIEAHSKKELNIDVSLGETLEEEQIRKMIYDIVILYDLWFVE